MSQSTRPRWIRCIVLPLLILLAFVFGTLTFVSVVAARTTTANTPTSPAQPLNGPAPTQENATHETQFMVEMMDHHFLAAQMAQVCLKKASHQQLLAICHTIISSQEQQISEMQSWLAAWYGVHHSPQLPTAGSDEVRDISSYSGRDFEIQFLEHMTLHHATAVHHANICLLNAYHSQLLDLCKNIVASQATEIRQMRQMLCDWYNQCAIMLSEGAS